MTGLSRHNSAISTRRIVGCLPAQIRAHSRKQLTGIILAAVVSITTVQRLQPTVYVRNDIIRIYDDISRT